MAGKFQWKKFSEIDIMDSFFNPLKNDYPGNENSTGFIEWFQKKANEDTMALVFEDDEGLGAFISLKKEKETIPLQEGELPEIPRLKISTLRLASRYRGQRLGEGAIGLILWEWKKSRMEEVYVTVFEKQETLITQLKRYGFMRVGVNLNGESVFSRSRKRIDYSDPYKSFPFINPDFEKSGYLIIEDNFHDTMFPYSELKNTIQTQLAMNVANGLCKIYVGAPFTIPHYKKGEPILIYRKYTGDQAKRYKSCITSYCVVNEVIIAKSKGQEYMSFEELKARIGNKSVFDEATLRKWYGRNNVVITEMLYYGYFGEGNNVNMDWLDKNGYWAKSGQYPADIQLSPAQFKEILKGGNVDVSNTVID